MSSRVKTGKMCEEETKAVIARCKENMYFCILLDLLNMTSLNIQELKNKFNNYF